MPSTKPEIETLQSRLVYESPWIKVHENSVLFGDGSAGLYNTVDKVDGVAVIAVTADGSMLFVEQFRYGSGVRSLEIPMGGWDPKFGSDGTAVAHTELSEETGFVASSLIKVGQVAVNAAYMSQQLHVYFAKHLERGQQRLESGEHGMTVHAFSIDEVEAMIRDGRITNEHTITSVYLARLHGFI